MATIFTRTLAAFEAALDAYFAHLGEKPRDLRRCGIEDWLSNAPLWDWNAKNEHLQEKISLLAGLLQSTISSKERARLNAVLDSRGQVRDDAWLAQQMDKLRK